MAALDHQADSRQVGRLRWGEAEALVFPGQALAALEGALRPWAGLQGQAAAAVVKQVIRRRVER